MPLHTKQKYCRARAIYGRVRCVIRLLAFVDVGFATLSRKTDGVAFFREVPLADIVARPNGRPLSRQPAGAEPAGQPASILLSAIEEFLEV